MQKMVVKIFTIAAFFSVLTSAANAFLGFGTNPAPTATTTASKVMSPDQFKSTVNSLNQQTQSDFSKQMQQDLAKTPPPSTSNTTNQPTQTSTNTSTTAPTPAGPAPSITTTTTVPTMSGAKPTQTTPPPNYSTQAPASSGYTGFGTGNSGSAPAPASGNKITTAPAPSGNSGGWNIQY